VYHNFLSKEEVDHIVGTVEKLVRRLYVKAATAAAALAPAVGQALFVSTVEKLVRPSAAGGRACAFSCM
jgi:hypothetical protein